MACFSSARREKTGDPPDIRETPFSGVKMLKKMSPGTMKIRNGTQYVVVK